VTAEIRCDSCRTSIPSDDWNREGGAPCPICRTRVWAQVFPAVRTVKLGSAAEAVAADVEAACYFHPQSKAAAACDSCGRFLCGLCDLDVNGQHLCPTCLGNGAIPASASILDNRRVLYDSIVLGLAIGGGMFFIWPSIVTGPLSVVLAIWYWKRPRSIVPRTPIRFILAIVIGVAQILLWAGLFWAMATQRKAGL
jgi:hypothetical protein